MSGGKIPSPDFDESRYERPNQNWLCGHTCDGCPCRIGPSPTGACRATTECNPKLEVKPGETKGTWKCTRPKDAGGVCENGPNPDGTCCKTIPKCQPVRSLRARRGLVVRAVVAVSIAILLIGLSRGHRETFLNPAPLSRHHSGPEFARLAEKKGGGQGCVLCHTEFTADATGVLKTAVHVARTSLTFAKLTSPHPKDFSHIDVSCIACHEAQSFHQANVARDDSCSVCHTEHRGAGSLPPVAALHCTDCHGAASQMTDAALKGRTMPAALFAKHVAPGVIVTPLTRPADGFTKVIRSFSGDHPEFQVLREKARDTNPLKFNHRVHLTGAIPEINGKPLDCAYCHQPDASGAFMQRMTFEQNCRACHALSFDENVPGLTLPHGDVTFVRSFLRSLPTHYTDYARQRLGLTRQSDLDAFAKQQIGELRRRRLSGENLERAVFFADARITDAPSIAGQNGPARAKFAGCAYCHEVTDRGDLAPQIAIPRTPDRWMLHSRFDHSKHTAMQCVKCHDTLHSERTADVNLPTQKSCLECHSPKGGVSDSCTACHGYHNTPPPTLALADRGPTPSR